MSAFAAIHAGLRQLGIVEDDARDLYERQTGKRSLREMSPSQLQSVVDELRRLGFKRSSKPSRKRADGKYRGILQALWIAAWNLGLTRDRTDEALTAFVQRQTKVDHTRFLVHQDDARRVIEGLKGWMAREADVDWKVTKLMADWRRPDGARIASAQWVLLGGSIDPAFFSEVARISRCSLDEMTPRHWITVMNAFGQRVRYVRKAA